MEVRKKKREEPNWLNMNEVDGVDEVSYCQKMYVLCAVILL